MASMLRMGEFLLNDRGEPRDCEQKMMPRLRAKAPNNATPVALALVRGSALTFLAFSKTSYTKEVASRDGQTT
ncbi:hypothetical protein OH491_11505 [Termitidicoccus mucosus]|uniref:hypothetical protein n=1 Tax=Termitidicoccus mucosus TaxID=1184151 RepID=UPI0011AB6B83